MGNSYSIRSTKIGNSAGFRLPAEFYHQHPQFANADGWIEVLSPDYSDRANYSSIGRS